MDSSYKPIVSQDMYDQVLSWLVEHSLKHKQSALLTRLCARHPDLLELARFPDKHLLVLHSFLFALKSRGPLPSIISPMFVLTLLDAVVKFVKFDISIFDRFDRLDVALLVCGLRFILIKDVFHSSKFNKRDVDSLLEQMFPQIGSAPDDPAWSQHKQLFRVQDDDNHLKEAIKTSTKRARIYFRNRMKNVAEENKKDVAASLMQVWSSLQSVLWSLLEYVEDMTRPSALECLEVGLSPWMDYVKEGAGTRREEDLVAFLEDLVDLRTESRFWLSYKRGGLQSSENEHSAQSPKTIIS